MKCPSTSPGFLDSHGVVNHVPLPSSLPVSLNPEFHTRTLVSIKLYSASHGVCPLTRRRRHDWRGSYPFPVPPHSPDPTSRNGRTPKYHRGQTDRCLLVPHQSQTRHGGVLCPTSPTPSPVLGESDVSLVPSWPSISGPLTSSFVLSFLSLPVAPLLVGRHRT